MKTNLIFTILFFVTLNVTTSCTKDQAAPIDPKTLCGQSLEDWSIESYDHFGTPKMKDVFFPSEQIGFAVSFGGTIMRITEAGKQWEIKHYDEFAGLTDNFNSSASPYLNTLYFLNDSIGYIGGEGERDFGSSFKTDAVLLKTINGGENWSKEYLDGVKNVRDLYFFDTQNGIGLFTFKEETHPRIVLTNNGGTSWEIMTTPIAKTRFGFTEVGEKLMIVGTDENGSPTLFYTSNQGQDWQLKQLPADVCSLVYFTDEQTAFARFGFTNQELSGSYKTEDGGNSWKKIDSPITIHSLLHFHSSTEGFVINHIFEEDEVSWEPNLILQGFEVFQTKDSGESWQRTEINKECNFIDISHSPSKNLIYTMSGLGLNRFELKQ